MKRDQFIQLLRTPSTINLNLISELEDITAQFPYFQNAHLLLAKQYHGHENIRYESYLRKASAYSPDRTVLYRLIQSEPAEIIHITSPNDHVSQADLKPEPDFKKVELELNAPSDIVEVPEVKQETNAPEKIQHPMEIIEQRIKEITQEHRQEEIERIIDNTSTIASTDSDSVELEVSKNANSLFVKRDDSESENLENENLIEIHGDVFEPKAIGSEVVNSEQTDSDEIEHEEKSELISAEAEEEQKATGANDELKSAEVEKESISAEAEEKATTFISKHTDSAIENDTNLHGAHSFLDWLKIKSIPIVPVDELNDYLNVDEDKIDDVVNTPLRKPQDELLDKFIITQPRIVAQKSEFYSPGNMARKSAIEHEDLISETLARIYAQQGNIPKAIDAYKRLSLKSPEKSSYFAALIKELEEKED